MEKIEEILLEDRSYDQMIKIKEILLKNDLYDRTVPVEVKKSNNTQAFFQTYHNDSEKKKGKIFVGNLDRDKNGFLILEDFPFIYSNKTESITNDWLLFNNGAKILLKTDVSPEIIEQELLVMYFLKSLNVSCANYEPVLYRNKKYLATPSFLKPGEKLTYPFIDGNDIERSFNEAKKYRNELHYLKTIFVDRICGNIERFPWNYRIIAEKNFNKRKQPKNCPLFDNGENLFNPNDHKDFPHLKNGSRDINEVISYLLENKEIMHWVINPMKKTNLQAIAERLKNEKDFIVSNITYKNFENYFKDSEIVINEELKSKGKAPCIKLT